MGDINEIPDKAELERQQLYLTNKKLEIETAKLTRESQPEKWWSKLAKNVVAIGGIVTVLATMYGLYDSYSKTIRDRESARATEQRAQFAEAIKKLEAPDTISRLVGVSLLSSFFNFQNPQPQDRTTSGLLGVLGPGNYFKSENKELDSQADLRHQIVLTLVSLAATDQDLQTQAAIADLLSAIPPATFSANNWSKFQDILASQSRALVSKGDLYQHRQFGLSGVTPSTEERIARFVGRLISINVRNGVVADYTNYAGIYCEDCDFRHASFPKNTNFTAAVLDRTSFRGASLEASTFDNTDLGGVNFAEADLRGARFRSMSTGRLKDGSDNQDPERLATTPYLRHIGGLLASQARISITMPNFSCANLEGARFDNFALIPVDPMVQRQFAKGDEAKPGWYKTVSDTIKKGVSANNPTQFNVAVIRPAKFYKANLRTANLGSAQYFTFSDPNKHPSAFSSTYSVTVGEFRISQGTPRDTMFEVVPVDDDDKKQTMARQPDPRGISRNDRLRFQRLVKASFYLATIDRTKLPDGIEEFLKLSPPTEDDYGNQFTNFFTDDPDLKCTPRTTPNKDVTPAETMRSIRVP